MGYIVGGVLSFLVTVFARLVGLDRDRAFYPTVLIVIGSFYVLFATMGGTTQALVTELAIMACFLVAAVAGFKFNLWIVVAGMIGHGIMDIFHGDFVANAGVPAWWPAFCMSYDVGAGVCLGWLLWRGPAGK